MKKLIFTQIIFLMVTFLAAQSNDLIITGQVVYEEAPTQPAAFQTVTIDGPALNSPLTVQTDIQGFYETVIINGSVIGPNQIYTVSVMNCNNQLLSQQVSNQQGTVDFAVVNFQICGWQGGCEALFTVNPVSGTSNVLIFDASQSVGENLLYNWSFGNGIIASGMVVTQQFSEAGMYQVCLNVNNAEGNCSNTYCDTIVIQSNGADCQASFIWSPSYIVAGQPVSFNNFSTGATNYSWLVNNTIVSNDADFQYTFSQPGGYMVCLVVDGPDGCTDENCEYVFVNAPNCTSNFDLTINNQSIIATPQILNPDIYQLIWVLLGPNGNVETFTGNNPLQVQDLAPGNYQLCLTVQLPGTACNNSSCQDFTINPTLPNLCNASIDWSMSNNISNTFTFTSSISDGAGFINEWFIENSVYSGSTVTHTFSQPGAFEVCLVVVNDELPCIDTICVTITVEDNSNPCNVGFTIGQNSPGALVYAFLPTGISANASQLIWNFGDGTSSAAFNPEHTYAASGIYNVCLNYWTTINGVYCQGVFCQTLWVGNVDTTQISNLDGMVYAGSNLADFGLAYLIRYDALTNSLNLVAMAALNNGQFHFPNVSPGQYLLKAALDYNSAYYENFLPTYYGDVLYWEDALSVNVVAGISQVYNIQLIFGSNPGGPGFVSGNVDDGANRLSQFAANPVAMADIILLDTNNNPQMWTRANYAGSYSLSNIAFGTYRLLADVPGIRCIPIEFTISEDYPSLEIDIVLGEGLTFLFKNEQSVKLSQLYPNPAQDYTILQVSNPERSALTFQIFDLQGRLINQTFIGNSSDYQALIPLNGFQSGIYQIVIRKNGMAIAIRKLVVTRP